MLDEIGEDVSVFLDGTQTLWSEALLDPDLSAEERRHWADRLGDWMEDFDETAADGLELLQIVVRQGWDDRTLTRILRGETVPVGLWGDGIRRPTTQRAPIARRGYGFWNEPASTRRISIWPRPSINMTTMPSSCCNPTGLGMPCARRIGTAAFR
ncbi:MAG: hypothetical protein R3F36_09885 [Candidatus Competibacteraceae bacterium]